MRTIPSNHRPFRHNHGFTLIEILVVVLIISVLAGIIGVNVLNKPAEARIAAAKMQIKQLATAIQMYRTEQSRLPTTQQGLEALVAPPTAPPIPERYPAEGYLSGRTLPKDPWGHDYIYLAPGSNNEAFEIISYGSDGEPGGTGEDADISSAQL